MHRLWADGDLLRQFCLRRHVGDRPTQTGSPQRRPAEQQAIRQIANSIKARPTPSCLANAANGTPSLSMSAAKKRPERGAAARREWSVFGRPVRASF